MQPLHEKWFVIACDYNFMITEIITAKNIAPEFLQLNTHISTIILDDNLPKFLSFALNLKTEKSAFGFEMNVVNDYNSIILMNFGGIEYGDKYVIIAFSNAIGLYEELMKMNNEHVNILREKLKKSANFTNNYETLSELNNEIINMQREIYKKNAYVSELLKKTQDMVMIIDIQKKFFKQMLNTIPDLIFYKDTSDTYLGCNKAFAERFIGQNEEEIIGKTDVDFFKDKQESWSFKQQDLELFETQKIAINEEKITMANNQTIDVEILKSPFYDENGNIGGIIGIARDISLRKSIEEKLRSAKEQAETATTMKSQFLATMSHEIRTPMNGILGFLDLLDRTDVSSEQKYFIKEAKTASEMLLYLINDILDFSKIEAGKLTIENAPFKLRTTIENTVSILIPKASEKGLKINTMLNLNVPEYVIGDSARLRQILNNLLSNAVKFTANGEITITVDCTEVIDNKTLLSFAVKDTGIGLSADSMNKLFKPFVQADASTTRKFGGTGLGLAICKELVKLMNGAISVVSEKGKGSTFSFTVLVAIPQIESEYLSYENETTINNKTIKSYKTNTESIIHQPQILVVEDNKINQQIFIAMLKYKNITCDLAVDGSEALNALAQKDYDMIFMDCQMPVLDGYECTAKIREREAGKKHTLIIAMTANAMEGDREKCLNAGMDEYVSKPINFEIIFNIIENYCNQHDMQ